MGSAYHDSSDGEKNNFK
jgi:hypothetical protein